MKDKKIFDILENAEYDSMKKLIDKCPEISDAQLDRIFSMSERKFRKMENGTERTEKDGNITMTENDTVQGVERSRRPVWLTPLSTAASMILIAGLVISSAVMISRNKHSVGGGSAPIPAVTATSSKVTGTTYVSTDKNGSRLTTTVTTASSEVTTAKSDTENEQSSSDSTEFIKPFTGNWTYQESSVNNLDAADSVINKGHVEIFGDATYKYTDNNGNTSTGTITKTTEDIGGTEIIKLDFSGDTFMANSAYYTESRPYELHFGNGYAARLLRDEHVNNTKTAAASYKTEYRKILEDFANSDAYNGLSAWDLYDLDNDGTPELLISVGDYHAASVRIYYYENGAAHPVCDTSGQMAHYGAYGYIMYCAAEQLLGTTDLHLGYYYTSMDRYSNHQILRIHSTGNDTGAVGKENTTYTVDNETVDEDTYNKMLDEFNSKNWVQIGGSYSFGDYSPLS